MKINKTLYILVVLPILIAVVFLSSVGVGVLFLRNDDATNTMPVRAPELNAYIASTSTKTSEPDVQRAAPAPTQVFEPDVYSATVIQVGGVGSDIHTNRAYYIGDGSGVHQEGWPNYLDKDTYARVDFNTPFYLMTLACKDGYIATLLPNATSDPKAYSAVEDKQGNSLGFVIEIKDQIKNQLSIKCKKHE